MAKGVFLPKILPSLLLAVFSFLGIVGYGAMNLVIYAKSNLENSKVTRKNDRRKLELRYHVKAFNLKPTGNKRSNFNITDVGKHHSEKLEFSVIKREFPIIFNFALGNKMK